MKTLKIFLLSCLALTMVLSSDAQLITQMRNPSNATYSASIYKPDTITNSATTNIQGRIFGNGNVTIQVDVKKVSGTISGYIVLEGSVDHGFVPVQFASILEPIVYSDTLTLADADKAYAFVVKGSPFLHYRAKIITSGTMKFEAKAYHYLNFYLKPD